MNMRWVPFTAHIKIYPAFPGKRFENWRDMQKIANLVYSGLETLVPSMISIASPGGGQHRSFGGTEGGGLSGLANGCAAKPQMGETPAQLMITGFFKSDLKNNQPHPELERIHAGEILLGPGAHGWEVNPESSVNDEVLTLKTAMEMAITAALPGTVDYKIFRIDYSGVIYGDRGYHFPYPTPP